MHAAEHKISKFEIFFGKQKKNLKSITQIQKLLLKLKVRGQFSTSITINIKPR